MTTLPLSVLPEADDLAAIIEQVVESILDTSPCVAPSTSGPVGPARCAWVTVAGPVPLLVAVSTSDADASAVAEHVLEVAAPSADDVDDALGELANVVGGNVKSLLPEGSTLSLPEVASDAVPVPDDATPHERLVAAWGPHVLQVETWLLPPDPTRRSAP